jgi:uncharacterized protein
VPRHEEPSVTDSRPYRIGRSRTGLGLFANVPIRKHALIVEYSGPRIATAEAHARERSGRSKYMFELSSRWSIDGGGRDNIGRYANHACRPNAESVLIRGKIFLKAIRPIQPGEEITHDYGRDYVKLFFKTGCLCASCRD